MRGVGAVLVTGVYGAGKTTVVEEMAELAERAGLAYGAIDLDWLWWFHVPRLADDSVEQIRLANVAALVDNFVAAGTRHLMLAGTIEGETRLDGLRGSLPCPLSVVRLTLPLPDIETRLASAVTTGRRDDLERATQLVHEGLGVGVGVLEVVNDRPVQVVAAEILAWLGWI